MKILAIDISGNFNEGKGTTGYCIGTGDNTIIEIGEIRAKDFETRMEYHDKVIELALNNSKSDIVVCENFKLYHDKALAQSYSELETPRIIGAVEYCCWLKNKPLYFQMASDVKTRFSDEILEDLGIIQTRNNNKYFEFIKTNDHIRDAMRHYLYFVKYKFNKGGTKNAKKKERRK